MKTKKTVLLVNFVIWAAIGWIQSCGLISTKKSRVSTTEQKVYKIEDSQQFILEGPLEKYKINSLQEFLDSEEAKLDYFRAAQQYYGESRFEQNSYYTIITNLQKVMKSDDNFKQKFASEVWSRPQGMGVYSIPISQKSYGKIANADKLTSHIHRLFLRVKLGTDDVFLVDDNDFRLEKISKIKDQLASESQKAIGDIESSLLAGSLNKLERDRTLKGAREKIFKAQETDARSIKIAQYLIRVALLESPILDENIIQEPDFFIEKYNELYLRAKALSSELSLSFPGFSTTLNNELTPPHILIKDQTLFRDAVKQGSVAEYKVGARVSADIVYYPVLRKFHGLFKGLTNSECVRTEIQRITTVLLPQSQLHYVEQQGSFLGFIELVALEQLDGTRQPTGKIIYSPTFGAGGFGRKSVTTDAKGGIFSELLYHTWLRKVSQILPENVLGIAKSEAKTAGNAERAIDHVLASTTYKDAEDAGGPQNVWTGEFGQQLATFLQNNPEVTKYSSYARSEHFFVTDVIETSASRFRFLDVSKLSPVEPIDLQILSERFIDMDCGLPKQFFEINNFNTKNEAVALLNCLEQLQKNTLTMPSYLTNFLNTIVAFDAMKKSAEVGQEDFVAFMGEADTHKRLINILTFLNEKTQNTSEVGRFMSTLETVTPTVVSLSSREAGREFARQALAIAPKTVSTWVNHMSDILAAMSKGSERRIAKIEQNNRGDLAEQLSGIQELLTTAN
jgi:hypothetical protein